MAGLPPYPETRAEPNNSAAAGAENPEIRRIFVRIVPASRTVVADPPCAEPAGGASRAAERKYKRKRYMADEKIIFSMVGVSKTFTNQKRVLNNIYLSFFLRREDRHHRSERLG